MKASRFILCVILLTTNLIAFSQSKPKKREFRGVWIHTVQQSQYRTMSTSDMKQYFVNMLDVFQKTGINAFIFQVRPQADAFYKSELEPWSRFLTGEQGKEPNPSWDPMAFLIEECHKRNIEFHAWLNPYRVTNNENEVLSENHLYNKSPELFIKYGKQIYFDPGITQNRRHICNVVKDIVRRYNVDAIHMDDYFYPYPIAGEEFPDDSTFQVYAAKQGFKPHERANWRRNNVNMLIGEIKETIYNTKPWVRFGVSPFGIYRNKINTKDGSGSETNGLENYSGLFADVLQWSRKSQIDYIVPQLYWEIGHKKADYSTLVKWWAANVNTEHLYIGQSLVNINNYPSPTKPNSNQLPDKMRAIDSFPTISGNCLWNGYDILRNEGGIRDSLTKNYFRYPALVPAYSNMDNMPPKEVAKLMAEWTPIGYFLHWEPGIDKKDPSNIPTRYCIYRFKKGEKKDINDPSKIIAITSETEYSLPYEKGLNSYKYVVTAIDKYNFESKKGKSKNVKL